MQNQDEKQRGDWALEWTESHHTDASLPRMLAPHSRFFLTIKLSPMVCPLSTFLLLAVLWECKLLTTPFLLGSEQAHLRFYFLAFAACYSGQSFRCHRDRLGKWPTSRWHWNKSGPRLPSSPCHSADGVQLSTPCCISLLFPWAWGTSSLPPTLPVLWVFLGLTEHGLPQACSRVRWGPSAFGWYI